MNNKAQTQDEGQMAGRLLGAVSYGLVTGLLLGVLYWLFDDMAAAYRGGDWDIALQFLGTSVDRFLLASLGAFVLAEVVTSLAPNLRVAKLFHIRWVLATALLTSFFALLLKGLFWFPRPFGRRGLVYMAVLGVIALAISLTYHWYQRRNRRSGHRFVLTTAIAAVVVLLGLKAVAFLERSNPKEETNVIVILIDALRSDHLGCYGYKLPTSPAMDKLARESLLFRHSFSQSTHTKPSISSLFTSLYPSQHNVMLGNRHDASGRFYSDVLDDSLKTLAEFLHGAGFNAAGFLEQGQLHSYMGFSQGFTYYNSYLKGAREINGDFFRWLPENKHRKFFAYLHYLDVHAPYAPSERYKKMFVKQKSDHIIPSQVADWRKFKRQFDAIKDELTEADIDQLKALYDAEIRELDDQLAVLFERLKEAGVYDKSLIILTADHGDSFMEHGEIDHGTTLYEEVLRVPLMVRFPGGRYAGVSDVNAETIDLLPTILDFFNIDAKEDTLMGQSLLAVVDSSRTFAERPVFSERLQLLSLREGNYKFIYNTNEEKGQLYDLSTDPGEHANLYDRAEDRQVAQRLQKKLLAWHDRVKRARRTSGSVPLDKSTIEKLKGLGYIR